MVVIGDIEFVVIDVKGAACQRVRANKVTKSECSEYLLLIDNAGQEVARLATHSVLGVMRADSMAPHIVDRAVSNMVRDRLSTLLGAKFEDLEPALLALEERLRPTASEEFYRDASVNHASDAPAAAAAVALKRPANIFSPRETPAGVHANAMKIANESAGPVSALAHQVAELARAVGAVAVA